MRKISLTVAALGLVLAGCSTTKLTDEPIRNQKLSTSFVSEKIKIETDCAWYKVSKTDCNIVAIESTGTAASFGNTVNNRQVAFTRAQMRAEAAVAEFMNKEVTSTRVQNTISKNIEKATDRVTSGKADDTPVELTDKEAANLSLRDNTNETTVQLTETIKTNARAMLRGFMVTKQDVTGDQEVAVTIRWDKDSERASAYFNKKFR